MKNCLKAVAAAFAVFAGVSAHASPAGRVLTVYAETPWLKARAAEIAVTAPRQLEENRKALAALRPEIERAFACAPDSIERRRTLKRLEIAEDLCRFVAWNIATNTPSSLQFAERGLDDLRLFRGYFGEELELWKTNPDNPLVKPRIVNAADYGVKGDGKTPAGAAFERCFDAVRALGGAPCKVVIPPGEYYFGEVLKSRGNGHRTQFSASLLKNVVIEGASPAETRFVFGVYDCRGGTVDKCENVKLRNIAFSLRETPFSEGLVTSVDTNGGFCVMKMNPLAKRPDEECFRSCLTCLFDAEGRHCTDATFVFTDAARPVEDLGGGLFKIYFERKKRGKSYTRVRKGWTICLPDRKVLDGMHIIGGKFVTFDSLWCRNSRSAAFSSWAAHQTTVVRCRIFPKDGFTLSTCADGYYTGSGSYLADSEFTRMHDDGNNSHGYGRYLEAQEGDDALLFHGLIGLPKKGDLLLLVSPYSGQYLGNIRASEDAVYVERAGKRLVRARFESLPPGIVTYASLGMKAITAADQHDIIFNGKKLARMPDHIYVPSLHGVGSVVTGCRMSSFRGTAIPSQAPNELIENNVIENIGSGIRLCGLAQWMEGPPPYHVTVRGNVVRGCNQALMSKFETPTHGAADNAPVYGCVFERNRVEDARRFAFCFENLGHSTVRDNVITGKNGDLRMHKCEAVGFSGNVFNGKPVVPGR